MNDPDLAGTEIQIFSTYRLGLIGIYNLTSSAKGFGAPKRKGFRFKSTNKPVWTSRWRSAK